MIEDQTLRRKAQEQMRAGKLPNYRPERIWGGSSFGGCRCALCGVRIADAEVALEIEVASGAEASTSAHLHTRCFLAFELELLQGQAAAPAPLLHEPAASTATGSRPLITHDKLAPDPGLPIESTGPKIASHGVGS